MTTAERRSPEADGWVPVHPTEGPDWPAFTMNEADTSRFLVSGYEWQECRVLLAADAPASPRDDFSPENDPFPEDAPASDLEISREWCEAAAHREGDSEVSVAGGLVAAPASGGEWRPIESLATQHHIEAWLKIMTDDAEHLLNIIEGKAEQEWNYTYQRERIAKARAPVPPGSPVPSVTEEMAWDAFVAGFTAAYRIEKPDPCESNKAGVRAVLALIRGERGDG